MFLFLMSRGIPIVLLFSRPIEIFSRPNHRGVNDRAHFRAVVTAVEPIESTIRRHRGEVDQIVAASR
jgi:hypothetical protein